MDISFQPKGAQRALPKAKSDRRLNPSDKTSRHSIGKTPRTKLCLDYESQALALKESLSRIFKPYKDVKE